MTFSRKPLCPYCNAEWTDEMISLEVETFSGGCDSCGPESPDVTLEINCANCKKLIYKKEGKTYDF